MSRRALPASASSKSNTAAQEMACRVVRTLSMYSKSNTLAEAGAIERQLVLRLFLRLCHKNGDIFFDSQAIVLRLVVNGDKICNFIHAKREVWEKIVAKERLPSRF